MARMTAGATLAVCVVLMVTPNEVEAGIKTRARRMSNQAAKLFAEHKYKAAAELFEQAYALDAAKVIRLRNAGRAYEEARLNKRALHCFRRYLERAKKPKLREDAKTRIMRLEARIAAAQRPTPPTPAASAGASAGKKNGPDGKASTAPVQVETRTPTRSMAMPVAVGASGVVAFISGGVLLWLAGSASADIDAAESRGDYKYPTGDTKLSDDRSAVSLNRGVGWGLMGVGVIASGAAAWLSLRGDSPPRTALIPAGPSDGPGLTAVLRF